MSKDETIHDECDKYLSFVHDNCTSNALNYFHGIFRGRPLPRDEARTQAALHVQCCTVGAAINARPAMAIATIARLRSLRAGKAFDWYSRNRGALFIAIVCHGLGQSPPRHFRTPLLASASPRYVLPNPLPTLLCIAFPRGANSLPRSGDGFTDSRLAAPAHA